MKLLFIIISSLSLNAHAYKAGEEESEAYTYRIQAIAAGSHAAVGIALTAGGVVYTTLVGNPSVLQAQRLEQLQDGIEARALQNQQREINAALARRLQPVGMVERRFIQLDPSRPTRNQVALSELEEIFNRNFRAEETARVEAEIAEASARSNGNRFYLVSRASQNAFRIFRAATGVAAAITVERAAVVAIASSRENGPICIRQSAEICEPASFWRAILSEMNAQ